MIDKKAKRYVKISLAYPFGPPLTVNLGRVSPSALSLRLFGADVTVAAKETSKQREERIQDGTHMVGVPDTTLQDE